MLGRFLADQLRSPSHGISGWVLARLWNRRNSALNDYAFDHLELDSKDRVLDIGFGGGYLLGRIAEVVTDGFLAGVDVSERMVASCRRRFRSLIDAGRLEVRCAQVESLPYPSAHFSKCCTVNSIFYWTDAPQGLAEIHRVLAEGGRMVACFTNKRCLERKGFAGDGMSLFEGQEFCQMMADVGFNAIEMTQASDRHRDFHCVVAMKK